MYIDCNFHLSKYLPLYHIHIHKTQANKTPLPPQRIQQKHDAVYSLSFKFQIKHMKDMSTSKTYVELIYV